jgi:hypothetical protein
MAFSSQYIAFIMSAVTASLKKLPREGFPHQEKLKIFAKILEMLMHFLSIIKELFNLWATIDQNIIKNERAKGTVLVFGLTKL